VAEQNDVSNAIADAVNAITYPLVGTTFTINEAVDAAAVGATHTVPNTTVALSRPMQKDLEDRLAAGKAIITVEPDESDGTPTQYVNEGRRQDLISRDAVTLVATQTSPSSWTLSGPITPGNIVGIQVGALGATYVVAIGDSLASVAANLAANAVTAGITAAVSGVNFSVAAAGAAAAVRIGAPSTWLAAVSRRVRSWDVLFWMPDPWLRSYLVGQTEAVFRPGQKLTMPDTSIATVIGTAGSQSFNTRTTDAAGRDNLFLARTRWLVEFTVTRSVTKAPVVAATVALDAMPIDITVPLLASNL
jgi:hypothetical protein